MICMRYSEEDGNFSRLAKNKYMTIGHRGQGYSRLKIRENNRKNIKNFWNIGNKS